MFSERDHEGLLKTQGPSRHDRNTNHSSYE